MKKYPIGVFIIFAVLVGALLVTLVYFGFIPTLNTGEPIRCDWCNEFVPKENEQLWELYLHDRCFSQLDRRAGEIWGCQYDKERLEWIYDMVKER